MIGIPDGLGDPTSVGQLDSDRTNDLVDYLADASTFHRSELMSARMHKPPADPPSTEDISFLPNKSPFEPIFHSLSSHSVLDGLDIVVDISTLLVLLAILEDSHENGAFRFDAEIVGNTVLLHRWLPNIVIGPGQAHRGWVQSYTRRVTNRASAGESWNGGTTQLVRYDLGGIGMLVRYPVLARVPPAPENAELPTPQKHTININPNSTAASARATPFPPIPMQPDHSAFVAIKVYSLRYDLDQWELFTRMFFRTRSIVSWRGTTRAILTNRKRGPSS